MYDALLTAYLARIGVRCTRHPDLATLRAIHFAHVSTIPFENLDILLGRGIHLDREALQAKLVARRRGGYCFEHNTLLLAVLRELGFDARAVEARVRTGEAKIRPRTHMALVVRVEGSEWLVDAGFGGEGPSAPVPRSGDVTTQEGFDFRLTREGDAWVLQARAVDAWLDQYAFVDGDVHPVDVEVSNWFTSTHPSSPFVRTLTAQRTARGARHVLRYPVYTILHDGYTVTREIARPELAALLRDVFLIEIAPDTRFPIIDLAR
jgi:N-hydroxyarylamine O-acetyltransferase